MGSTLVLDWAKCGDSVPVIMQAVATEQVVDLRLVSRELFETLRNLTTDSKPRWWCCMEMSEVLLDCDADSLLCKVPKLLEPWDRRAPQLLLLFRSALPGMRCLMGQSEWLGSRRHSGNGWHGSHAGVDESARLGEDCRDETHVVLEPLTELPLGEGGNEWKFPNPSWPWASGICPLRA